MQNTAIKNITDLSFLLSPKSIAVVGASDNLGPGRQVLENLEKLKFEGEIIPINPRYSSVRGLDCYPSLTDAVEKGHRIEMVAILLGRDHIVPVLEEAGNAGVKAAWAFASGFAETGSEGVAHQDEILRVCREKGMTFCGPNCVGILNFNNNSGTYSAPAPENIIKGNIGMVAQSGYLCIQVANANRGLGFSMICSAGNEAVVDSTDYIAHMLEDPGTDVVMAFIEQFRKPERLAAIAERARELGKPIIVIKVGRSELAKRATAAHTGALAGSDDVQDALFKHLGIIRVDDMDEMFETAKLFSSLKGRRAEGKNLGVITLSGGVISLLGDISEPLGLTFPVLSEGAVEQLQKVMPPYAGISNPLDAWGYGRIEETYDVSLKVLADETDVDIVLVSQDVPGGMAARQVEQYSITAEAAVSVAAGTEKPVVYLSNPSGGLDPTISEILEKGGVPLLQGSKEGLKAIRHLVDYSAFLKEKRSFASSTEKSEAFSAVKAYLKEKHLSCTGGLSEYHSKNILSRYGVSCTEEILCSLPGEAVKAAEELKGKVALKVMSPDILHKTEAGVIALNLEDEDSIKESFIKVLEKAAAYNPDARIDGVLCQKMMGSPVAEAIIGVLNDPDFGPAVVFGLGGVLVEVIKDSTIGIPPLTRSSALKMIEGTKGSALLKGFRGNPPGDIDALVEMLINVGDFAIEWADEIEALDINPVFVMPEGHGVCAVDALLMFKE